MTIEHSDWDLAVAFDPVKADSVLDTRIRAELLAMDWQRALGLAEGKLSVVDINFASIPPTSNKLIFSRDEGRRMQEESRIMSQMELDYSAQSYFIILDKVVSENKNTCLAMEMNSHCIWLGSCSRPMRGLTGYPYHIRCLLKQALAALKALLKSVGSLDSTQMSYWYCIGVQHLLLWRKGTQRRVKIFLFIRIDY